MPSKKRFPAQTVRLTRDGKIESLVRRHDTPDEAFAYATGRNHEANGSVEYAVILRTTSKNSAAFPALTQVTPTAKQPSRRFRGKPRYPLGVVTITKEGTPKEVTVRNTNYAKAVKCATNDALANSGRFGDKLERAVLVRTATRGGAFPTFKKA